MAAFLIEKKALNIHMGVSPYYRGTACNFWALYDNNPHLVGATIHLLSKGLDSGPILYHALSQLKTTPFEYTMSTVKAAFHSIAERIQDQSILKIEAVMQDKNKQLLEPYFLSTQEQPISLSVLCMIISTKTLI